MVDELRRILPDLHTWMDDYIKTFYTDDEEVQLGISLKEKHIGYVTANSRQLAEYLQLSEHDATLAEIIGLFHDVGRFAQYSRYRTFNDALSEDHADLGVAVMDGLPIVKKLSGEDYDVVRFAVKNHNKKEIAPTEDERALLFAKIVRDADKLDIYRVLEPYLLDNKAAPNFIKAQGNEVSPDFVELFRRGEQVDFNLIRTHGDRKLVRLMWVYDINFAWTLKRVTERGYVQRISAALQPMNDAMREGIRRLNDYIEKRCAAGD